jgi:hypothetical protein
MHKRYTAAPGSNHNTGDKFVVQALPSKIDGDLIITTVDDEYLSEADSWRVEIIKFIIE